MSDKLIGSAVLMGSTRLINVVIGLLQLPLILYFLGVEGFAIWALLNGASITMSTLELGVGRSIIRYLAEPMLMGKVNIVNKFATNAMVIILCAYGIFLPLVILLAPLLTAWLKLSDGPILSVSHMVVLVFLGTFLRSVLSLSGRFFYAAQHFRVVASEAFLLPFFSNIMAIIVAWQWQSVDAVLLAYWITQLFISYAFFIWGRILYRWQLDVTLINRETLKNIIGQGIRIQVSYWAQVVNFQFDKFIIAGLLGLESIIAYEAVNRAMLALRSISITSLETFLPSASIHQKSRHKSWQQLHKMNQLAVYLALVFMFIPIIISPFFLPAWFGSQYMQGAWVLFSLLGGATLLEILALPAISAMQAQEKTGIYAKTSILSIVLNIPLSLLFIQSWGSEGAVLGTAIAIFISHAVFLQVSYRWFGYSLSHYGFRLMLRNYRFILLSLLWILPCVILYLYLLPLVALNEEILRLYTGSVAIGLYLFCVSSLYLMFKITS